MTAHRVSERRQKRREYLDQKANAYASIIEGGLLIVGACFFLAHAPDLMLAGFNAWESRHATLYNTANGSEHMYWSFVTLLLPVIGLAGVAIGLLGVRGVRLIKHARKAACTPYIPPVTLSNLPAEEVLVRGAVEPPAPSTTLLRATVKDEETKAEELLRVASGAAGEQN